MAKPTQQQLLWAQAEVGVIIHYDIPVFAPEYFDFRKRWGQLPDASVFNPTALQTDQWVETAKRAGARYAILVVKHGTGFCLFPTEPYSVRQSSYRGDIAAQFVASCKKYGLRPGFYYNCTCSSLMQADVPGRVTNGDAAAQKRFAELTQRQLRELWSRYGDLFEIWFDGGLLPPEKGGPDLKGIYEQYQPNAVRFQGSALGKTNNTRWVGNERGTAPSNCWSATNGDSQFDGTAEDESIGAGDPDGARWAPAECDAPNRRNEWFWKAGEDRLVLPGEALLELYYKSVGRNCNLLLGMVVDNRGLVPDRDAREFARFGELVRRRFAKPLASTAGQGRTLTLRLPQKTPVDHIVLRENLENGHAVRAFSVDLLADGRVRRTLAAECIGNKRIFRFPRTAADTLRLTVTKTAGVPDISEFSALFADDFSAKEKLRLALFGDR